MERGFGQTARLSLSDTSLPKNAAKNGKTIPSLDDVLSAFRTEPPAEGTTTPELETMNFFLNVALPAVDPTVLKAATWSSNRGNHFDHFQRSYPFEIATALLLVGNFSDLTNVLHNAGLVDDQGNRRDGSPKMPQKKKRKKMQTKAVETQICTIYYRRVKQVQAMLREPDFKERMIRWDKKCCSHRNKVEENGPAQRANTVPRSFREMEESSEARDFIISSGVFFGDFSSSAGDVTPSPCQNIQGVGV